MTRLRPPALLAALLAGAVVVHGQTPGGAGAAAWLENLGVSVTTSATWVENISRTSNEATRKNAATYDFSVSASRHQQLAPSWLLQVDADAEYVAVPRYDLTSCGRLGTRAGLQRKFGLGPFAPVLQFDAGLGYKAARLAADRGWTTDASLRLAKRFGPALKVSAGGQWTKHDADSPIFAIQQRAWSVEAAWDFNDRWRLTGSAGRLNGTIVANAAWNIWSMAIGGVFGPTVSDYYNSIPWGVTDLYGTGWVSYTAKATVDQWSLALDYEMSDRMTLELRAGSAFVVNKIGVRYPTESWGLGLNYRF